MYEYAKKRMTKHRRVYNLYQMNIESKAFKRDFVTYRNAVATAKKRTLKTIDCEGSEREEMLKEDLRGNVTLCLYNSFCRYRETNVDPLP